MFRFIFDQVSDDYDDDDDEDDDELILMVFILMFLKNRAKTVSMLDFGKVCDVGVGGLSVVSIFVAPSAQLIDI